MARRRKHEEHENHERWLVSYADFITLLFAFFVVMYAVSSVNEGKYRTLSHSLIAAFQTPSRSIEPIQVGELARTRDQAPLAIDSVPRNMPLPEHMIDRSQLIEGAEQGGEASAALDAIADRIVNDMRPLIEMNLIKVRRTSLWLEVELNTNILFASGSVALAPEAYKILRQLAEILRPFPNPIRVEGFTDNVPISTSQFGSNWELSAVRAAQVVRLFAEQGMDPARMAAVGFGEHRPVADNLTVDGRNQNRRVALVVLAGQDSRYLMDVARDRSEIQLPAAPRPENSQ
jgi:chemotaxis protein MotB